jgi:hypothetical protein
MVESSGTAPESDPVITCAFMFIVPRDILDISGMQRGFNHSLGGLESSFAGKPLYWLGQR